MIYLCNALAERREEVEDDAGILTDPVHNGCAGKWEQPAWADSCRGCRSEVSINERHLSEEVASFEESEDGLFPVLFLADLDGARLVDILGIADVSLSEDDVPFSDADAKEIFLCAHGRNYTICRVTDESRITDREK